jgi:arylsulfatase A-like enzyme
MGQILAELKSLGIDENTVVMFTSDNGSRNDFGPSCGHLRGGKGQTWEGGMRVPLIVRWPGTVPAGVEQRGLAASIDLLPTIASFTGAKKLPEKKTDGIDLSGLMTGARSDSPREVFYYYHYSSLEAIREGKWKLHVKKKGEELRELYDLEADPSESNDLAAGESAVVERLTKLADEARADLGDAALGIDGDCRPIGRVPKGRTLTQFNAEHPYYMAEYDLDGRG